MTLSEIRTLLTNLQQLDLDNYAGTAPSNADYLLQINRALRWFANETWCCYDDKVTLTLTAAQRLYDLHDITTPVVSKKIVRLDHVVINGVILRGWDGRKGLWQMRDMLDVNPGYLAYTDGTPAYAFMRDDRFLVLSPAPTAGVVSTGSNYLGGVILPTDLSGDSDVPAIPYQYHEWIAYIAAVQSSEPMATEQETWMRLERFNKNMAGDIQKLKARSRDRMLPSNEARGSKTSWSTDTIGFGGRFGS